MNDNPLGNFILRRMEELGIRSQVELSKKIGKSHTYVRQLIEGCNPSTGKPISPTVAAIEALAKGLRVDPDVLIKISRGGVVDHVEDVRRQSGPIMSRVEAMGTVAYPPTAEEIKILTDCDELGISFPGFAVEDFWQWPAEERRRLFRDIEGAVDETRMFLRRIDDKKRRA